MISFLTGKILTKRQNYLILLVNDVGYKIFINTKLDSKLKAGENVELYIHQHIREDGQELYGFANLNELEFFELLISVSGVGPKSALNFLALAEVDELRRAIAMEQVELLTKVSGIGRKTAERVILELKNKIGYLETSSGSDVSSATTSGLNDEIDALMSLGYSLNQAREALNRVDAGVLDSGERVRLALRSIKN